MTRELAALRDASEAAGAGAVVAQHMQRMFACVKPALAGGDIARVFIGLADFVLKATAPEILVEPLVRDDRLDGLGRRLFLGCLLLRCRLRHLLLLLRVSGEEE